MAKGRSKSEFEILENSSRDRNQEAGCSQRSPGGNQSPSTSVSGSQMQVHTPTSTPAQFAKSGTTSRPNSRSQTLTLAWVMLRTNRKGRSNTAVVEVSAMVPLPVSVVSLVGLVLSISSTCVSVKVVLKAKNPLFSSF